MAMIHLHSITEISSFHAHIYFDPLHDKQRVALLREHIAQRFLVQLGAVFDRPVGPHPLPMFLVVFSVPQFATFVPWLMLNHQNLSVLVHPNTDNEKADHTHQALWLGSPVVLRNLERLPTSLKAMGYQPDAVIPNTHPTLTA